MSGERETPAKASRLYPLLAAVLAVGVVAQILYVAYVFRHSDARRQGGSPAMPPPAVSSGAPAPGPPAVSSGAPAPGPPAVSSGVPAFRQPGRQAAMSAPYVGSRPTSDTATWLFVPGDLLLGALRKIDSAPATALSARQLEQMHRLLDDVAVPSKPMVEAQDRLVLSTQKVLDDQQLAELTNKLKEVQQSPIDGDALVADLKRLAGGATEAAPSASEDESPLLSATFALSALSWMQKSATHRLTQKQAAQLAPLVADYLEKLKAVAALYPRVVEILNPTQMAAFVQVLHDMHSGKIDPAAAKESWQQTMAYLNSRMGQ